MPDSDFVRIIRNQFPIDSIVDVNHPDKSLSYKLIRELGKGNFGITYMAEDLASHDTVALKVEPEMYGKASITVFEQIRFLLERSPYFPEFRFHGIVVNVKYDGKINSPKIIFQQAVPPLDVLIKLNPNLNPNMLRALLQQSTAQTTTATFTCTVMDFVKGISLDQKQFSLYASTFYIWQAAKGIAELHAHGIIHGDIKPENLMIDLGGKLKLLDFTTAFLETSESKRGSAHATSTFSPWAHFLEQKPTRYSDIYGLGATLYYLATGVHPEVRNQVNTRTEATVYCKYYEKLSLVQQPWRAVLMAIFSENVRLMQSRNMVQVNPTTKYAAQIAAQEKDFSAIEPICTAEELIGALAPLIKEYEPQRRKEWNKQRKDQQLKNNLEAEKRWQHVLESVTSSQQIDHLIREETQIRETTEMAFREEWDSETHHRSEIESELGYLNEKAADSGRDAEERNRRSDWEKSLAQWQQAARGQLLEKLVERWTNSHQQEWNLEIERQMEWDKPRLDLGVQWKKRFQDVRQSQQKLPLEVEKQEYWIREIKTFEHKLEEYVAELNKEQERRKLSIRNLANLRKTEQRNRSLHSGATGANADFLQWEKKEQQSLDTLSKWYPGQLAIVQDLRRYRDLLQREEQARIASRTFKDKFTDWATTAGIKLTKIAEVSTEKAKTILTILAVLAVILFCGYTIWKNSTLPNLDTANNYAVQADTSLQIGIEFEKLERKEEAQKKYREALNAYLRANEIYDEYFRLYPTQKNQTISTAHFNASICGWNSYLILNTLNDPALPNPLDQLIFAEKHLKIYNTDFPSKDNEENLLKYNIYILILSDTADYSQSMKSLEEIVNRIQSLGYSLTDEDRSALFGLAQEICANDMPDIQKARCNGLMEQLK